MDDFDFWRRTSADNLVRAGGNKWNRELAALMNLYAWATKPGSEFVPRNPVPLYQALGVSASTCVRLRRGCLQMESSAAQHRRRCY
ncbi:hypothetical protein OG407_49885 [Streptomyces sp. NBC_01515]|uniref:hypothetical protein n=1 Tax=Streptomyces sp. NBC_01515 TaxID=2903890 RepID=UPI0038671B86